MAAKKKRAFLPNMGKGMSHDKEYQLRRFLFSVCHMTGCCTLRAVSNFIMARNEEKQFGKLNRLWLQKEKEGKRVSCLGGFSALYYLSERNRE